MLRRIIARLTRKDKRDPVAAYWCEFYADVARLNLELAR